MLLFGAPGLPANMAVQPKPAEGIRWTFMAATNSNANALLDMSKALRQGIGTSTNLTQAYAWLSLYAKSSSGLVLGQVGKLSSACNILPRTSYVSSSTNDKGRQERMFPSFLPHANHYHCLEAQGGEPETKRCVLRGPSDRLPFSHWLSDNGMGNSPA